MVDADERHSVLAQLFCQPLGSPAACPGRGCSRIDGVRGWPAHCGWESYPRSAFYRLLCIDDLGVGFLVMEDVASCRHVGGPMCWNGFLAVNGLAYACRGKLSSVPFTMHRQVSWRHANGLGTVTTRHWTLGNR